MTLISKFPVSTNSLNELERIMALFYGALVEAMETDDWSAVGEALLIFGASLRDLGLACEGAENDFAFKLLRLLQIVSDDARLAVVGRSRARLLDAIETFYSKLRAAAVAHRGATA